ncbi:DUF6607 family protein [Solimonas sp. SE-A11]|uniref:DUF6607 family protein n=1 Tax=Solimonas sp. SE-A11 TaxID=3054954 RepID=UPI00259C7E25|nr:DUF6607 family protein [Solimonas sp. SE-A11]MDM4771045.1 hypothetical protein [Solimonas sp. SE-A11]
MTARRPRARERELNTYTGVQGYDFGPGREYWRKIRAHWSAVRAVWAELLLQHPRVVLREEVDGMPHYMAVMAQANDLVNKPLSDEQWRAAVSEVLQHLPVGGRALANLRLSCRSP